MNVDRKIKKELQFLKKTIDRYIESFGVVSGGFSYNMEFYCYPDERQRVYYSPIIVNECEASFKEMFRQLGLKEEIGIFTLSLLHEIGHCMTEEFLTKEEYDYSWEIKHELEEGEDVTDEKRFIYYALPDEHLASMWALEYINSHLKEVRHFDNLMKKNFKSFYDRCLTR